MDCTCHRRNGRLEWVCDHCLARVEAYNADRRAFYASDRGQRELMKRLRANKKYGWVGHPQLREK